VVYRQDQSAGGDAGAGRDRDRAADLPGRRGQDPTPLPGPGRRI